MPVIDADSLTCEYAPQRGVRDVSLTVEAGQCVALLGRNGSGKTTLTRLLLGLRRPDAGRLSVLGCPVDAGGREHLRRCGAVLDRSVHWEALSGRQNAWFAARSYGVAASDATARIDELLTAADLGDRADDPVATYSYGMRRKLDVVCAMIHQPDLLLLDEPTAGLDPQFLLRLTERLRRRSEQGRTTWLAGNDVDFAAELADRVVFLDAGAVVADAPPADLLAELDATQEVRIQLARPHGIAAPQIPGVRSFAQNGEAVEAVLEGGPAAVEKLIAWVVARGGELRTVEVRSPTLRDAFLLRTGKTIED